MPYYKSMALFLAFLFVTSPISAKKTEAGRDLAVCAVFQNEAAFMKEWIEFHKLLGVQHFYLYNNLSTDHYQTVLEPYLKSGEVELIEWPYEGGADHVRWVVIQTMAIEDAIRKSSGVYRWLAILDLDEYLFTTKTGNLVKFLKDYEEYGGLMVNWVVYGTSWVDKVPSNKLMIETLTLRGFKNIRRHFICKSIVHPHLVTGAKSSHCMIYKEGYYQVNPSKEAFKGHTAPSIDTEDIRINHYWCRDMDFFLNVKYPRRARLWNYDWDKMMQFLDQYNKVRDKAIFKYVPALRKKLGLDKNSESLLNLGAPFDY